jgi:hypothetical protein
MRPNQKQVPIPFSFPYTFKKTVNGVLHEFNTVLVDAWAKMKGRRKYADIDKVDLNGIDVKGDYECSDAMNEIEDIADRRASELITDENLVLS